MSAEEKVGKIVLWPLKVIAILIAFPLLVIAYPFIGLYLFIAAEGSIKQRLLLAIFWPLAVLALNDFLSLDGLDNPWLSRISDWLKGQGRSSRGPRKKS